MATRGNDTNSSSSGFFWVWELKYHTCHVAPASTEKGLTLGEEDGSGKVDALANWADFGVRTSSLTVVCAVCLLC